MALRNGYAVAAASLLPLFAHGCGCDTSQAESPLTTAAIHGPPDGGRGATDNAATDAVSPTPVTSWRNEGDASRPAAGGDTTGVNAPNTEAADAAANEARAEATSQQEDSGLADAAPPSTPPFVIPRDEEGCHAIYAQDLFPTFELTIAPEHFQGLMDDWNNGKSNAGMGLDPKPFHPLAEFRYGDTSIDNADIRLRGNPDFWEPLPDDKMQFHIRFRTQAGRFQGIKRLVFDAATFNRHMLRDRLALSIMRDAGLRAPCANHARLVINGEFYGVFTSIEKLDKSFLKRTFEDATGDLWKRANWVLKTNENSATNERLSALRAANTIAELESYLDLAQALKVFAAEAVLPDSDGMWAGGLNFYLYDEPLGGKFMLLPWDLDNTFERFGDDPDGAYPKNPDPILWEKPTSHGRPWYDLALLDAAWRSVYVDNISEIVSEAYVPEVLHDRIDTWTSQIQAAVLEDTNKPYSNDLYLAKVGELHRYIDTRHAFLTAWLACRRGVSPADAGVSCGISPDSD
jgi:hypothetical protein